MEKLKKLKCTFQKICDTIKDVKEHFEFYKMLWDKPQGKAAFANVKSRLIFLLKKSKPRRLEGNVTFGTGDPALTGQALGAIAALYGFCPSKLRIVPDFDEKRIEGELYVKGRLRLIHVLSAAVRLVLDRNVRYIMKKITARGDYDRRKSKEDVRDERK